MISDPVRRELEKIFRPDDVLTDPEVLVTYSGDAGLDRGMPDAVVFVETAAEIQAVVHCARRHRVPFLPRASGTSLSGGPVPCRGGIIVECSRMRAISIDSGSKRASVEPGVINLDLQKSITPYGLFFPPDPASQRASCLGGNIAENAGGPLCFKYGVTGHYVLGLEIVLPDGTLARTGGLTSDYPEYDFTGVLVGSEGTLGIVTHAHLKLINIPAGAATLVASFDSLEAAAQAVSAIIAGGIIPAALELMDQPVVRMIESSLQSGLPVNSAAILIVEIDGPEESLAPQREEIQEVLKAKGSRDVRCAGTAEERERIWYARRSVAGAIARLAPYHYTQDGTVPRSRLAEVLRKVMDIARRFGLSIGNLAHAGDGNLHPLILFNPQDEGETRRVLEAGMEILRECVRAGGVITGEHGVGLEKKEAMHLMYTPSELNVMRDLKRIFDPAGLCNPGKIFPDTEPVTPEDLPSPLVSSATAGLNLASAESLPGPGNPAAQDLRPAQEEEVASCLLEATRKKTPLFVVGGGTKVFLGNVWRGGTGRLLSMARLSGVVDYAPEDLVLTVGSGTPLSEIHRFLAASHLQLPWGHPWSRSTVGGVLSCNWNSPGRLRRGSLRDHVLGLRVVLPRGEILRCGSRVVKNVAGYDLTKLFIGALGTLGVILQATLKLSPRPQEEATVVLPAPCLSDAITAGMLLFGDTRLIPDLLLTVSTGGDKLFEETLGVNGDVLIVSFQGRKEDVASGLRRLEERESALGTPVFSPEKGKGVHLWESFVESGVRQALDHGSDSLFVKGGVPGQGLLSFLRELDHKVGDCGGTLTCCVEIGFGVFYAHLKFSGTGSKTLLALCRDMSRRASELGSYWTLAAASDQIKAGLDVWGEMRPVFPLMKALKNTWDPSRILNPGKFAGFI